MFQKSIFIYPCVLKAIPSTLFSTPDPIFVSFWVYLSSMAFCKYISPLFLTLKVAHTIYNSFVSCILHDFLDTPPYQQRALPHYANSFRVIIWKYHSFFKYSTLARYVINLSLLQKMAYQS